MYEILVELQGILQAACTTQFSKYMVGKVSYPFKMDLPFLCIYGLNTQLQAPLTTCKDRYTFSIRIDIFSNVYNYVSTAGTESDDVIKAQKSIYEKMEKRTTGQIPDADTVLGAIRRLTLLRGTNFLFSNDIVIDYSEELVQGSACYKGSLTFNATTVYNMRS